MKLKEKSIMEFVEDDETNKFNDVIKLKLKNIKSLIISVYRVNTLEFINKHNSTNYHKIDLSDKTSQKQFK